MQLAPWIVAQRGAAACVLGTLAACTASYASAGESELPAPLAPAPADPPAATLATEAAAPAAATIAVAPPAPTRAATIARATASPPPPVEQERVFYGWINMLIGEAFIAGAFGAAFAGVREAGLLGVGYLAGGPIVHALYGEGTHGWVSLGLNIGLPLVGLLSGLALDEAIDSTVGVRTAVGALTGFVAAPILDGLALGWTYVPVEEEPAQAARFVLMPRIDRGGVRGIDLAVAF